MPIPFLNLGDEEPPIRAVIPVALAAHSGPDLPQFGWSLWYRGGLALLQTGCRHDRSLIIERLPQSVGRLLEG